MKRIFVLAGLMIFSGIFAQKKYTIQKGDTAYGVSKRFGMSLQDLYKLNPSIKDGKLSIGQEILVKGKENTTSATTKNLAKKETDEETDGRTGKIYIQPKQTLYGLTRQYKISEAEIRRLNPNLGMKIGEEVILPQANIDKYADSKAMIPPPAIVEGIPITENQKETKKEVVRNADTSVKNNPGDGYVTYTVQSGDTVFGIIHKYGITLTELLDLNPELSNGLKAGTTIRIKKVDQAYVKKSGNSLNVVLMMPFGFDTNDSKYRSMASDFLTGAKLAMERNARNGLRMNINIVDTGNEKSFKNSLTQINQENTDLIIGPFFKSNIVEVMDFLGNNKIPVVAPFANSEELYGYSNLVIMETSEMVYTERIAKEVTQNYNSEKIYIVAGNNSSVANLLQKNLEKFLRKAEISVVKSASEIVLDKNMMTGKVAPVITILASDSDEDGTAFTNKVIALTKEVYGIKAFSLYATPSFDKKVDELSQASLVYLIDRKINTEGSFEKEILEDYRDKYCKTPPKYAIIGFDVVNDILSRENAKGEVFKNLGKTQTQLATKFEFVRVKSGGAYVNTGYRVVRLLPQ